MGMDLSCGNPAGMVQDSELTVEQCGEPSLALQLVSDSVLAVDVDVYRITKVWNIPDDILFVIADSFLI